MDRSYIAVARWLARQPEPLAREAMARAGVPWDEAIAGYDGVDRMLLTQLQTGRDGVDRAGAVLQAALDLGAEPPQDEMPGAGVSSGGAAPHDPDRWGGRLLRRLQLAVLAVTAVVVVVVEASRRLG